MSTRGGPLGLMSSAHKVRPQRPLRPSLSSRRPQRTSEEDGLEVGQSLAETHPALPFHPGEYFTSGDAENQRFLRAFTLSATPEPSFYSPALAVIPPLVCVRSRL